MSASTPPLAGVLAAVRTAELGSFTAAAGALGISVAAASKNVAHLEAHLGVRLFNRTSRRVTPTQEGLAYVAAARAGLASLDAAAAALEVGGEPHGRVRLASAVAFGRQYVLPLLPAFFRRHPRVQVELVLDDQSTDLVAAGFDIGIRGGAQPPEGMVARPLGRIVPVVVASPRYLRTHGTPTRWRELADHRLIRLRFLSGRVAPWLFHDGGDTVGLAFEPQLTVSDPEIAVQAALLHLGIARVARHHAHAALARGELVTLLAGQVASVESGLALFYPHRAGLAARVRVLVDHLVAGLAEAPGLRPHDGAGPSAASP